MEKQFVMPPPSRESATEGVSSIVARWGKIGVPFTPIPLYFLEAYHRLGHKPGDSPNPGTKGLTSTEALVVIHLASYRWTADAPYPSLKSIAERMGLSQRAVRKAVTRLEDLGYLRREERSGFANRYHFDGLIRVLEEMKAAEPKGAKRRKAAA